MNILHPLKFFRLKRDFIFSENPEPHRSRTKQILKNSPHIRNLIGKNPSTFLFICFLVISQIGLSWFLSGQPWWLIVTVAYLVGAFLDHALFVMIHECAHRLIFKNQAANKLAGIFANMPQIFPSSVALSGIISNTIHFRAFMNWMLTFQIDGKQS